MSTRNKEWTIDELIIIIALENTSRLDRIEPFSDHGRSELLSYGRKVRAKAITLTLRW